MTIYLKDSKRKVFVDIEINTNDGEIDVHSNVNIENYSYLLLERNCHGMINDFEFLNELRQWYWEMYKEQNRYFTVHDLTKTVIELVTEIGERYGLFVVTD